MVSVSSKSIIKSFVCTGVTEHNFDIETGNLLIDSSVLHSCLKTFIEMRQIFQDYVQLEPDLDELDMFFNENDDRLFQSEQINNDDLIDEVDQLTDYIDDVSMQKSESEDEVGLSYFL